MRPAFSVIFFTVVSGCGYGLLFLLGLTLAIDATLIARDEALLVLAVGAIFVVAGLLSSTLHLGQPQRAWRAFSQWRTSWLSREGVASLTSFAPMLALAWCLWRGADANANVLRWLGGLLGILSAITVVCTAGIYTSLKTIPAWHNRFVLPGYLLMGLLGGVAWFLAVHELFGAHGAAPHTGAWWLILFAAFIAWGVKIAYWKSIDKAPPVATPESATGLGRFGAVRSVEAPHTEENYLTHEMGFALARKHGVRLREISVSLIGPIPIALATVPLFVASHAPLPAQICAIAAVISITSGLFVERWLFFAQAKHVVMLYYGGTRI